MLPSPLKSPAAIAPSEPPPTFIGDPMPCANPPPGWRSSTVTVPAPKLATARSGRPSPLKSPTAPPLGAVPTGIAAPSCAKPPGWRRNTEALEPEPLSATTSGRLSPLKSAEYISSGSSPVAYGEPSVTNAAQAVLAPTSSAIAASTATILHPFTGPIIPFTGLSFQLPSVQVGRHDVRSMTRIELRGGGGEPVDFARTLLSHGVAELVPNVVAEDGSAFETVLPAGGRAWIVRVKPDGAHARVEGHPDAPLEALMPVIRHMFRLDDDLTAFYARAAEDPQLAWAATGAGRI